MFYAMHYTMHIDICTTLDTHTQRERERERDSMDHYKDSTRNTVMSSLL